ncbi:2-C-methyl-D-erythritol 4-phosphate cytidylyltransferase [Motilibacter aurantiacus]|uniref:2-C-methyl-D-erythritol 4-phosphate cytidylyltransferase n=1 Tax=Motilibacter aurantiacus TaxID=2714955 RepID=UPI00140B48B5|nr:2-C-methyl-D-erythritol 4-phosphate cytidylyltransferase [Motilibacter aurantiacus]
MRTAAVVPAAGRGERLGPGGPKALRLLAGEPLLVHAVRALGSVVDLVVVAAPPAPGAAEEVDALLRPVVGPARLVVVAGGGTRQESVRLALAVLPAEVTGVLVHDAARPLAPAGLARSVLAALDGGADAVIPALPVTDTVKLVDAAERVVQTVDRSVLRAVQTPQGFRRDVLAQAHGAPGADRLEATDDAGLVERLGLPVLVVPGSEEAFKVTRPLDLALAEAVLAARAGRS